MQKSSINFHKIYTGTKHANKANKTEFTIYYFSKNSYAINKLSDIAYENTIKS